MNDTNHQALMLLAINEAQRTMNLNYGGPFGALIADENGKLYSESIESMDIGVKEALLSCGGNNMEVLFRAVIPQVAPEFLSYTLFRFEINMRAATTLGLVGAGGIGASLIFAIRGRFWERVGIIIIVLVVTVTIIDILSSRIRKKLV